MVDYKKQREENIAKNMEILMALGLPPAVALPIDPPAAPSKKAPKKKKEPAKAKKRTFTEVEKVESDDGDEVVTEEPRKQAKIEEEESVSSGTRRSSRHAGKPAVNYSGGGVQVPKVESVSSVRARPGKATALLQDIDDEDRPRDRMGHRIHNPKTFGHIPGIPVGKWWELRMHCSTDAVHAPTVAGISGNPHVGAWSIALSGGYEDDVDLGEAFTFTGAGGRDLKGTKAQPKNLRTAPQSKDQSFETSLNGALLTSSKTRKPVRVIRGYKGAVHSRFAPASGYRYDGLYIVEKAWMEPGLNKGGFKVCKYAFKRLPNQPSIPVRSDDDEDEDGTDAEEMDESTDTDEMDEATEATTDGDANSDNGE